MSSIRKTYRSSNAVNGTPAKRAKQNQIRFEKRWETLEPFLNMATKAQVVDDLTKKLFEELYKRNGDTAVSDIITSVTEKHMMNKNRYLAETTWNFDNGGVLTFEDGLQSASLMNLELGCTDDECRLVLQSSNDADTLEYEGEIEGEVRYGHETYPGYKVYLSLKYNPVSDTIKGKIEADMVLPTPNEEEFDFTGTREEISDDDSE